MNDATRNAIANALENLAIQQAWNPKAWQACYDLVETNWENELLQYINDHLIHYDGVFHSRNILGLQPNPDRSQLEQCRREFRDIAAALRANLSLDDAKNKYDL